MQTHQKKESIILFRKTDSYPTLEKKPDPDTTLEKKSDPLLTNNSTIKLCRSYGTIQYTVSLRSLVPFYIVSYFIKWVKISWTYSSDHLKRHAL